MPDPKSAAPERVAEKPPRAADTVTTEGEILHTVAQQEETPAVDPATQRAAPSRPATPAPAPAGDSKEV